MASDDDNIIPIKPKRDEMDAAEHQQMMDAAEHSAEEIKAIRKILHGDTEQAMNFVSAFHEMMDFERVAEIRELAFRVVLTPDGPMYVER